MYEKFLICSWCGYHIYSGEKYFKIGKHYICTDCVEDSMEEFDPEGDEIDMQTDEMIERRFNNG